MAGINPVIDPLQRKLVCGPEEGQNTTVDGFQVNVIGDTGSGLYNAGDGIDIEGSTINVALTAGYRGAVSGSTVGFDPTGDIVTVTGASVTLQPDTAYKIMATTGAVNVTANPPPANKWAYEGHAEIFVASVGYVQFDTSKIVLANALKPDAVNNCTLRFHDGMCYVSVEDHIAGYIVVSATGTTAGTLPYALTSATQEYVAFDASLNGATVSLSGATASGEKHIVGNGRTETIISGGVTCTSKTTFTNLTFSGSVVADGATEFADGLYHVDTVTGFARLTIGSGVIVDLTGNTNATPIAPGGGISFAGGGATILYSSGAVSGSYMMDNVPLPAGAKLTNTAVVDIGGSAYTYQTETVKASGCTFTGATTNQGFFDVIRGALVLTDCTFSGNATRDIRVQNNASATLTNCKFYGELLIVSNGAISISGEDNYLKLVSPATNAAGTVTISSGASINLTSSINPGSTGGITVLEGGCTVNGNAIAAGTYTSIDSTGTPN